MILTLPACGLLKETYPHIKVYFLCSLETQAILEWSAYIDKVFVWKPGSTRLTETDALLHVYPDPKIAREAKRLGVQIRIGTNRRFFIGVIVINW